MTGLKHWHLRPQTNFYPKKNFERVISGIPDGSTVIFMFGEIDCREGILEAVEKDRYDSIEEGIEFTIMIFIRALRALRSRNFKSFVHPVIPVLNETRQMVTKYNHRFREKVNAEPDLVWMDGIFENLLDPRGKLKKEYELDGILIIHPLLPYLPLSSPHSQAHIFTRIISH